MGYLFQDVGGSIPAPSAQSSEAAFDSLRVRKVELSPPKLCTKDRAVGQNCDPYTYCRKPCKLDARKKNCAINHNL